MMRWGNVCGTVLAPIAWGAASSPKCLGTPAWHRHLCEWQKLLEGLCFICKHTLNFIHVCISWQYLYLLQWVLHDLLVRVIIPLEI